MHQLSRVSQDPVPFADLERDSSDSAIPVRLIHSFLQGPEAPQRRGGGQGVPRSYCPPRFLGIAPAKRVKASFSSIVQEGISRRSSFQLARESAESDLDSGHLSPEHPTPFWKRPSSALYLQPGLLLPVTLGQAQQPTETSVFAQSRLQPASRPCSHVRFLKSSLQN